MRNNQTMATLPVTVPGDAIADFCQRNDVRKRSFFGSILGPDFRPDSDIDVLIEFPPGGGPELFGMARMERELSALLGGRKVDLRTPSDLSRYFRDEVVSSALLQYAGQ